MNLINADGICKSPANVVKFFDDSKCSVVNDVIGIIDCTSNSAKSGQLIKKLLNVDFPKVVNGKKKRKYFLCYHC